MSLKLNTLLTSSDQQQVASEINKITQNLKQKQKQIYSNSILNLISWILNSLKSLNSRKAASSLLCSLLTKCASNIQIVKGNSNSASSHFRNLRFLIPAAGDVEFQSILLNIVCLCIPVKDPESFLIDSQCDDLISLNPSSPSFKSDSRVYLFNLNNLLHSQSRQLPVSFAVTSCTLKKDLVQYSYQWNEDTAIWVDFNENGVFIEVSEDSGDVTSEFDYTSVCAVFLFVKTVQSGSFFFFLKSNSLIESVSFLFVFSISYVLSVCFLFFINLSSNLKGKIAANRN